MEDDLENVNDVINKMLGLQQGFEATGREAPHVVIEATSMLFNYLAMIKERATIDEIVGER